VLVDSKTELTRRVDPAKDGLGIDGMRTTDGGHPGVTVPPEPDSEGLRANKFSAEVFDITAPPIRGPYYE